MAYDPALAAHIRRVSQNLGISPSDLGTAISYETGGKFDHNMWGGANKNYLGLIQFGPEERAKYGVKPNMPLDEHFNAVENFLRDRGVKPGMGMLDLYSTINAGSPGRYNASDADNGGMPGTVADKVATQMVGHRARANTLLGDAPDAAPALPAPIDVKPAPVVAEAPGMPMNIAPTVPAEAAAAPGFDGDKLLAALGKMKQQPQQQDPAPPPIQIAQPAGLPVAQRLAAAMQRLNSPQG